MFGNDSNKEFGGFDKLSHFSDPCRLPEPVEDSLPAASRALMIVNILKFSLIRGAIKVRFKPSIIMESENKKRLRRWMINKVNLPLMLCLLKLLIQGCSISSNGSERYQNVLYGSDLRTMGRFAVVDQALELVTSGAHAGVRFKGEQCIILASVSAGYDHNYIQYELDGVYQKRLKVSSTDMDSLTITAPSPGEHILWIYKATEAHTGPVFIHQLLAEEIKPVHLPEAPLIEFIGNSITCGAAADPSEVPCGTGKYHDQHNAYLAYGPRVARAVNANFILSSVSGIGVYRNWNSDGPVMPDVYNRIDFGDDDSRKWDFKNFIPEVVSIALGTNDFSRGDGMKPRLPFDSAIFTTAYVNFVKAVKAKYPDAKVVLLNSPMISGKDNDIFVDCLNRVKQQVDKAYPVDNPVKIFLIKPMTPGGCTYHPNVEDHKVIAGQLVPFFRDLLKEIK